MGLASTASRWRAAAAGANAGQRSSWPRSSAATGSLSSKASTQGPSPCSAWRSSSTAALGSEEARLRSSWSRSTSIRAVPSTPNRASADATTRSRASSTVTGDDRRSASWSSACRSPATDTVMSARPVGGDALVGAPPDDSLVVRVAGRRVLDPLLRLLQQGLGLGLGVLDGVARLVGQRLGPAVDLLGARLVEVRHRRGAPRGGVRVAPPAHPPPP